MKDNIIFKWVIPFAVIFAASYGILWQFMEPLGLKPGFSLLLSICVVSLVICILYFLIQSLIEASSFIKDKDNKIKELEELLTLAQNNTSHCCVIKQKADRCPLGIVSIHREMQETLTTSVKEAKKSFKWLGLSAFNVVHNNKDIFSSKRDVSFEFVIANPENINLAKQNDEYYGDTQGRLNSYALISQSKELLDSFKSTINKNVVIKFHNQMPTFRVIIVDDKKAYVSFYEKGKDALKSVQIEVEDNDEYSILNWFTSFFEKTQITEKIINPKSSDNG